MFSMFGRTRAPEKRDPLRPENVGQQRDIFWPVRAFYGVLILKVDTVDLVQHDILWPI